MVQTLPTYMGQKWPDQYLTSPNNYTPAEIRQYLARILVLNHQCNPDQAREIASLWSYGRGSDFYQYDLDTFKDMFGDEVGMLFYLYSRGLTPGGRLWNLWDICCVQ